MTRLERRAQLIQEFVRNHPGLKNHPALPNYIDNLLDRQLPTTERTNEMPRNNTVDANEIVTTEVATPARAARVAAPIVLHDCLCGCGEQVRGEFRQGHDARLRSRWLREWRDGGMNVDPEDEIPAEAISELPEATNGGDRHYCTANFCRKGCKAYRKLNNRDWLPWQHRSWDRHSASISSRAAAVAHQEEVVAGTEAREEMATYLAQVENNGEARLIGSTMAILAGDPEAIDEMEEEEIEERVGIEAGMDRMASYGLDR